MIKLKNLLNENSNKIEGTFSFENYDEKTKVYVLHVNDNENALLDLLKYLQSMGSIGHSIEIEGDVRNPSKETKFGFDGDGSDKIYDIKEFLMKETIKV